MAAKELTVPERMFRAAGISRADLDAEKRTLTLSFSSEEPVKRWGWIEVLGHKRGEIDTSFIGSGRAPLLIDHDTRVESQIGVVESVTVSGGKARAVVRFGRSELADEILARVTDGELANVSVGYRTDRVVLAGEADGIPTYRATAWTPYEISIVTVPADPSVGVGRAATRNLIIERDGGMPPETENQTETTETRAAPAATPAPAETRAPAAPAVPSAIDASRAIEEALGRERKRTADIHAVAAQFNCRDLADKAIRDGVSVEAFKGAVLEHVGKERGQEVLSAAASIGLSREEIGRYSFVRLINALANPQDPEAQRDAGFELQVSAATRKHKGMGGGGRGVSIPVDVLRGPVGDGRRDLTAGTATAGGNLVATDLLSGSFIELLRNRMMVRRLGATVLNDLVGNVAIPRQTGGATAYWVAENAAPTESQQSVDQVTLTPKTVGAYTDISRRLLIQSSIDVEAMVRRDLAQVLALEIDRVALHGTGSSNQPRGLAATSGIGSVAGGTNGAQPTWGNIIGLETQVATANADVNAMAYLTNAPIRGRLKQTEKAASSGAQFIWGDAPAEPGMGTVNGYRAGASNQVAANLTKGTSSGICSAIFFGNWADLMLAFWSGLDLLTDPYSQSTSATVRVTAFQDVDIAVRLPASFAAMLDALP